MPAAARLAFWGLLFAFIFWCHAQWQYITGGSATTYSAPHVVSEYADVDGDGFVPAQGDPLYDAHYAQEVNKPNSEALVGLNQIPVLAAEANLVQAQAEQTVAETERIRQDTKMSLWGTRVILAIVVAVVLLIAAAILR